jgi:hypothetical protein
MPDILPAHHIRVPREDRSLLSIPDLETASQLVEDNRRLFASSDCALHGRRLNDLRSAARRASIAAARSYTGLLLRSTVDEVSDHSCIVSGHQPELFHIGVWAKNFTLSGVARRSQSVPINLVIDNDLLEATAIRVPAGNRDSIRIDRLSFDTPRAPLPWEEALVLDESLFRGFGNDVSTRLRNAWGIQPLIESAWPNVGGSVTQPDRLCDRLTALRAREERRFGLNNLELPMSHLCETEPFHWFFAHLIMRLPEFHRVYNEAVSDYRREHGLRNRMQPVPDLATEGDWLEAPFWIWRRGDLDRGRLFARRIGNVCELRHGDRVFAELPFTERGSLEESVEVLSQLPVQGLRLRTRALTTTLFARVCLADLFVHGIGGARYDAMTDRICERLFGLKAPSFLTVSATLYLPLGGTFPATDADLRDINHRLRDLGYNPDRHLPDMPGLAEVISEKGRLIGEAKHLRQSNQLHGKLTPQQHRRLKEIRASLQAQTSTIRKEYELARSKIRAQLSTNRLVRNREYPFVLYPEQLLRDFLTPLSQP